MKQLFCLFIFTQISIAALAQNKYLYLQNSPENYKAFGLIKDTIKSWEGGSRISGNNNSNQCWYYDTHLDDGTNIMISFMLRDGGSIKKKITPYISVDLVFADGRKVGRTIRCMPQEFSSSKEKCDIHFGKNFMSGDLKNYVIHIDDPVIKLDISFEKTVESWRSNTGFLNFGDTSSYCGWLVPVPEGNTKVSYTVFGKTYVSSGICYHDNTWWSKSPRKQINRWGWSASRMGPYKVITYEITAVKKYKKEQQLFFAVFKDGKLVVDDANKVSVLKSAGIIQPIGKKLISNTSMFTYTDTTKTYELTLEKNRLLLSSTPIKGKLMRAFVKFFTGFDGAYYRIRGNANLKVYQNNCVQESYRSDKSMWELFYFDNPY